MRSPGGNKNQPFCCVCQGCKLCSHSAPLVACTQAELSPLLLCAPLVCIVSLLETCPCGPARVVWLHLLLGACLYKHRREHRCSHATSCSTSKQEMHLTCVCGAGGDCPFIFLCLNLFLSSVILL